MFKHRFSPVALLLLVVLVIVASPALLCLLVFIGVVYGLMSAFNAGIGWGLFAIFLCILCPPAIAVYGAVCAVSGGNCITD